MSKTALGICMLILISGCSDSPLPTGQEILSQSMAFHDPQDTWGKSQLNLHIQEPRVSNPSRYSELVLDNRTGNFKLTRNRDEHMVSYFIEENGSSYILFNGQREVDSAYVKKYRLDPARNTGYRNFYGAMMGLPMSLQNRIDTFGDVAEAIFNEKKCFKVEVELKEALFSKKWNLFINRETHAFEGMEIVSENEGPGEFLIFDGEISLDGMKIRRMRHWYESGSEAYLGSDILVQELE